MRNIRRAAIFLSGVALVTVPTFRLRLNSALKARFRIDELFGWPADHVPMLDQPTILQPKNFGNRRGGRSACRVLAMLDEAGTGITAERLTDFELLECKRVEIQDIALFAAGDLSHRAGAASTGLSGNRPQNRAKKVL